MEDFEETIQCFLDTMEMSKAEPQYHYRVFNTSVHYLQAIRPFLQPGRCQHLVPSLRKVIQNLEEVDDQDHSWRAELMMHLITCLVDSGEINEAANVAKVTETFIKSHVPHLYSRLFTLMVRHKLTETDILIELSSQCTELSIIYKIQEFKNRLEEKTEANDLKQELEQIFHLVLGKMKVSRMHLSSIPASPEQADRVAFLLELALLALHVKHQKVAANCLKELKSVEEASVGQRIIMECVNSEIKLVKKETMMDVYSRASIEARLKEITKLDHWLQTAVREGDPQAMQAVCATQWSFCLPLLQPKFRKYIRTPLLNVANVLEEIQSMFVEMRCQLHSELAAIEEEKGRLEASLTHLQKALLLDNGTQREHLLSSVHLLQLRTTLDHVPSRQEDKAAQLMQKIRDLHPKDETDIRPTLVSVGLLLAPDEFQMVLDADNISENCHGSGPAAQLCERAKHHSSSVCQVDGHLARQQDDPDNTERVKLWATLVKTAAKRDVWDVCRSACRFCLLYDDGRWTIRKPDKYETSAEEKLHSCTGSQVCKKDVLRLLAEIHFISAEATIQKLLSEGVRLNAPAVPPVVGNVSVSKEDPLWIVYRDWIQELSTSATSSLLRAAELGTEIRESWLLENAAIYLWNYSTHLLAAGGYHQLLPAFQAVVELLQKTDNGHHVFYVLLCDAVARGIIQPLTGPDNFEPALPADEGKKGGKRETPKMSRVHRDSLSPVARQDVHKALKLCEQALCASSCTLPGKTVPIAVQKQLVATWVQTKQLLHQQIGSKMDSVDKCEDEDVLAMTRVLVGVEMLRCNMNPGHMEFTVPSLSNLVKMTSECSWSDALVELHVWCQLAAFCYQAKEHSLLLLSIENALKLEEAAAKSLVKAPYILYGLTAVRELLSIVLSLKGLMLIQMPSGDLQAYKEAMKEFLSSVSYAEKAENDSLCVTAGTHFWNTCLPLIHIPHERCQLQEPLERILTLIQTRTKHKQSTHSLLSLKAVPRGSSLDDAMVEQQDLNLRTAIYVVLLHNRIDKTDWKGALELLDKAIRDTPCSRQQLVLRRERILVKVRQGESIITDMQKMQKEGEAFCSSLWHQAALCASAESQWKKVVILLEFGQWLYQQNFPKEDVQRQVHLAIDILLQKESDQTGGADDNSKPKDLGSLKCESMDRFQDLLFTQSLAHLKDVRCLDSLVQAHVLLAIMAERTSPEYQLNLLKAFTFVLQIWQVSMATYSQISPEIKKYQETLDSPSDGSRKGSNTKNSPSAKGKPESVTLDQPLPSTPEGWVQFVCPEHARQNFRTSRDPCCINTYSITNQTRSLYFLNLLQKELQSLSLGHLTLPILHLAETIAKDLLDCRSLSDLYGLRIVKTCYQLGWEMHCPYQDQLINMTGVCEQDLMERRKAVVLAQQRREFYSNKCLSEELTGILGPENKLVNIQDIWLEKAEVCVSMGLYQAARELLSEAYLVSVELRDDKTRAKTLLSQASLACGEQKFEQALIFLEKAQVLGGDENFWYLFTLTLVKAIAGKRKMDAHVQIDQIINQGCEALKLLQKQQINRVSEIKFMITSLRMRGAVECVRVLGSDEPGETLSTKVVQRLTAAYETLRECGSVLTELNYREHAAEVHKKCAYILRVLADDTSDTEDKQHFLLDGLSHIQLAVSQQEHVVLKVQTLLPSQSESHGLSLESVKQLQHLRLALADFSLAVLGEHCAEKTRQALAQERMTAAEIALEQFLRSTPEPCSTQERWINVGMTLEHVVMGQLDGIYSQSQDIETNARCLLLRGKYFRLMAVQKDPLYPCAIWNIHTQPGSDPEFSSMEGGSSKEETDKVSGRREPSMTSAQSAKLQKQRRGNAQKLLSSAIQALAEAITLCLQHKLPPTILADASLTMLECHGQWDSVLAGQHLALFQSCCTASTMVDVLSCACADTSTSQLSALLNLHKSVLDLQKERSSRILKEVEDFCNKLSKSSTLLTISPNHLDILAELPTNLKILLLQHSKDGSELYGAFYEMDPNQIEKVKDTGTLACSRVAKVSVCPQALQALREQCLAFSHKQRQTLHQKGGQSRAEEHQNSSIEETSETNFKVVVQHMEEYLNPLLSHFDFRFSRPQEGPLASPELTKPTENEKNSSDKEPEQYVIVLADMMLMDLPLEALSILQDDSLCSVSRDFSLQLLHGRLSYQSDKGGSDSRKETKDEKRTKGKRNQSQVIKEAPEQVLPSNTFPVDMRNFRYIVDPNNKTVFEETSLSMWMQQILEKHKQLTHLWKGFLGSQQKPGRSEVEKLLCTCSGFLYLGMESFGTNIPPAKLAALNMSECRVALLFDLKQNASRIQSAFNKETSGRRAVMERPSETALLLSLCGVGCVVLQQWPSSVQETAQSVDTVLDYLLRVRQTSGQAVHVLRTGTPSPPHQVTDDPELDTDSNEGDGLPNAALKPSAFNCILFGLPNLAV